MPRRANGSQGGTDAMQRKALWLSFRTSLRTAEGASTLALVVMVAVFALVALQWSTHRRAPVATGPTPTAQPTASVTPSPSPTPSPAAAGAAGGRSATPPARPPPPTPHPA